MSHIVDEVLHRGRAPSYQCPATQLTALALSVRGTDKSHREKASKILGWLQALIFFFHQWLSPRLFQNCFVKMLEGETNPLCWHLFTPSSFAPPLLLPSSGVVRLENLNNQAALAHILGWFNLDIVLTTARSLIVLSLPHSCQELWLDFLVIPPYFHGCDNGRRHETSGQRQRASLLTVHVAWASCLYLSRLSPKSCRGDAGSPGGCCAHTVFYHSWEAPR